MSIPEKNPIRRRRESRGLDRDELATEAGIRPEDLLMVEGGGHIVLSLPLATKLARALGRSSPQELIDEYAAWRHSVD